MTFHQNWMGLFEAMPAYLDTARFWRSNGVFYGATGMQVSVFNAAIVEDPEVLSVERLNQIEDTFDALNLPFSLQVYSPEPHPPYESLLHQMGYVEMFCDPLMVCNGALALPERADGLCVTPITTAADREHYRKVIIRGFDLLGASAIEFLNVMLNMRESYHVIGWLDDTPVGAGTVILCGGAAGVYNVATVPSARRKGVASAVMEALHHYALDNGYPGTSLAASQMGVPLYERLGYRSDGYQIAYLLTRYPD